MSWEKDVDELKRREAMAEEMGGADSVAFHHGRGKLTVRERFELLADPGSIRESGKLAGSPEWDGNELKSLLPANSVAGSMTLNGRKVAVHGGDFTIRGGSSEGSSANKALAVVKQAWIERIPYIRLLDATGGSVRSFEQMGRTYLPANDRVQEVELLYRSPVVSAVLGSVAGLPAVQACFCHFNVMVKGTSQVFVAGPPAVRAALGREITKEELGNEDVQVKQSGVIANLAESEADAMQQIRRFLSYMPQNVWEMPPRITPEDAPDRAEEALLSIIPDDPRKIYNARKLLGMVVDRDSFFEIQPDYGKSRITGLARFDGYPVGIMINNPKFKGGSLDKAAGEKVMRLLQLCDTFHLPLISLVDEPGFMVGLEEEKKGIIRAGARATAMLALSTTPLYSIIIRQAYGVAGGMHFRGGDSLYRRAAWPSGNWGSMHIEGGVTAAYRREIEAADDPAAKQAEIEERLNALKSPFRTAHAYAIENIIDPRATRQSIIEFVHDAQRVIQTQLGPTSRIPYLP
ncbi:MAG: hypothetical protein KDI36_13880 [Pseudomonadales bacterium]|nr:hypothetical protein [Pseudomonadales bacterium]